MRTPKHRYIYFTGKSRKLLKSILNYTVEAYPKGDNKPYVLGVRVKQLILDTTNNIQFWE